MCSLRSVLMLRQKGLVMVDFFGVAIGKYYRNIKTGDIYQVVLLSFSSELGTELLVSYKKQGDALPWTRPLALFIIKFEEVGSNVPA